MNKKINACQVFSFYSNLNSICKSPVLIENYKFSLFCRSCILTLLLSCFFTLSWADDQVPVQEITNYSPRFSGYGTLGYATDNNDNIAPIRDVSQKLDSGYLTGDSWKLDSRLGFQVDYRLSPDLELVVQMMLRDQVVNNLNSKVELAYLGLTPKTDWDLRIGRFGYDIFLLSDHRNLGYSYYWIRPPEVYYSWLPIFSVDGIDAIYKFQSGDAYWRIKGQLGQSQPSVAIDHGAYQADVKGLFTFNISRESGPWRAKIGFSRFKVVNEVATLIPLHSELDRITAAGTQGVSAESAQLRKEIGFKRASMNYLSMGLAYDDGLWQAQAELGMTDTNKDFISASDAAYISVGRRIGKYTPFVIISALRPNTHLYQPINNWGADANWQSEAIHIVNSTRMDQKSLSLGLRWDINQQSAVKLQWTTTQIEEYGYGLWWRPIPYNGQDHRVDMLSTSLDFIF